MRQKWYLVLLLVAACLLAACAAAPAASPTAPPAPTLAPSATALPTATLTPAPPTALPPSAICTPLAQHELPTLLSLYLTQPYTPPQGANRETGHHGVDFAYYSGGPTGGHVNGTPIQSVLEARVAGLGYNAVYGYYLITETPVERLPAGLAELYGAAPGDALYLLYAHMQHPASFAQGDGLACGQVLGHVGDSGDRFFVSDPHLHFETRLGAAGLQLGPMAYYSTTATQEEQENYLLWRSSDTFILSDPLLLLNFTSQP